MIANDFIPISKNSFYEYILKRFNIDISNIPVEDWNNLIYKDHCKNITNNIFCFKKFKKINIDNTDICSKCCEKKGVKRKPAYKKRKNYNNSFKDITNNNEDSGFYTETDNDLENKSKFNVLNYESIQDKDAKEHDKKYSKIQFKENEKKVLLNNNYINNSNYIQFGSLKFKIDQYENVKREIFNKKLKKRILTKIKILNYFKNLYLSIKNKTPIYTSPSVVPKYFDTIENVSSNYNSNNDKSNKKSQMDEDIINNDIYYVFVYIINLIFRTKNVNYIRKEIFNCLGGYGLNFYRSQFNYFY